MHRGVIGGAVSAGLAALLATSLATSAAAAKTTITVGVIWGQDGTASAGFEPVAKLYEATHPDVDIQFLWGVGLADDPTASNTTQVVTMTAAGEAPDLVMVGGQSVPQYAVKGFLLPLDSFAQASGVQAGDFIPPAWNQEHWDNKLYAMTLEVDPNFALLWNKQMFSDSGLNPDVAPATTADLQADFEKLTKQDANTGTFTQIGMEPWNVYGNANTLFTWGWIYGGSFYNSDTGKVTADDPNIVAAATYLRDMYTQYPYSGAGFPTGKVGMAFAVSSNMLDWVQSNPKTKFGIGLEPYKADTSAPNPAWIGGWAMGISKTAKHPQQAWDFLRFMTATADGTQAFSQPSGWIPAYLPSPVFKGPLSEDPYMSVYLKVALTAHHQRPAMPAIGDYTTYLNQALTDILAGKKQPKDALAFVSQQTQLKLAQALGQQ